MLIRTTESVCPTCFKKITANLIRKNDEVYMEKTCPKHGKFVDKIGKYEFLKRAERYDVIGKGMENPRTEAKKECPHNCGICPNHKSYTVLGIIDVTNRCNLRCPVCFANSAATGYIYEPTKEQIRDMLQNLRNNKPVPTNAVQFSVDGEETILVKDFKGRIKTCKIGELVDRILRLNKPKLLHNPIPHEKGLVNGWKVLTIDENLQSKFEPIAEVIRHKANEELYRIITHGGWEIRTTGSHSIITIDKFGKLISKAVKELKRGDYLIGLTSIPQNEQIKTINLIEIILENAQNVASKIQVCNLSENTKRKIRALSKSGKVSLKILEKMRCDSINLHEFLNLQIEFKTERIRYFNSRKDKSIPVILPITSQLCRLLGYYVGEGCVYKHGVIFSFSKEEKLLIEDVIRCIKSVLGETNVRLQDRETEVQIYVEGYLYKFFFEKLIGAGGNAHSKKVPWIIFNVSEKFKKEFLKSYHLSDGHTKTRKTGFEINYTTISRELTSGLMLLHIQLGILPRHEFSIVKPHRIIKKTGPLIFKPSFKYRIVVGGKKNLEKMLWILKEDKLDEFKEYVQSKERRASQFQRIPLQICNLQNIKYLGKNKKVKYILKRTKYDKSISIQNLRYLVGNFETMSINPIPSFQVIKKLVNGKVSILKILRIERIKSSSQYVYDISVKNQGKFFCGIGPLLAHNSGGEPTVREDLPELIKSAKSLGFDHVEVNTNGIAIFNKGPLYIEKLVEAGMDTLYLQFDGFGEEIYKKTRGVDLTEKKLKIIEYCRKVGFKSVVLVVTLVNDVNTHQVGKIIRYAAENNDVVRCVNFQPVSITGRMDRRKLKRARVTNSDLIELIEKQTDGEIKAGDFYPVPFVVSFARAMGTIKGKNYPEFTCHPYCGTATFIFVEDGKIVPISKYVNLEKFEESLRGVEKTAKEHKTIAKFKLLWSSIRNVHPKILSYLFPVLKEGSYEGLGKFMRKLIMIGSMHFMDPYNFDFERVQRCVIHYAIPDGRIIPFCTMNTFHRVSVEKKFSKPLR